MVELLIKNSAIFNIDLNVKDIIGWTAFHLACVSGKTSIVEVLMDNSEHFEIDLTSKDNQGRTGFMIATNSVKDIMRIVMEEKPNIFKTQLLALTWNRT